MTSKRYVLLLADGDLSEGEKKGLASELGERYGKVRVIFVQGNSRAFIVRTTNEAAPLMRGAGGGIFVGARKLTTVMTSGGVGKLKRRVSGAEAHGQVP